MSGAAEPDVSVLVVSYNTRELTLAALRSLFAETMETKLEVLLVDNASVDGSADAVAQEFPDVTLIRSEENLGFARANNVAAKQARGRYLLLLNPDTVVLDRAVDRLVGRADRMHEPLILGGRTLYGDRSLNPTSCWAKPTLWSTFCRATGLTALFPRSHYFAPESYGDWQRDSFRQVDIVTGCFLLIPRSAWERLDGFDEEFFMYGEEADLCLRAARAGFRAFVDPEATIVHYGGRSASDVPAKWTRLLAAKRRLALRHWPRWQRPLARPLLRVLVLLRLVASMGSSRQHALFKEVWRRRAEWLGTAP